MRGILITILLACYSLTSLASKYDYTYLEAVRQKDLGNYVLAFELYKRCLEMEPDASEAHYGIGDMYMGMKMDSLALVHLTKATTLEPGNTEYLEHLAQAYLYRNDIDSGVAAYERL